MAFHFLGQQRESLGRVWCQCCMDFLLANAWGIGCPKLDFISDQSAGFFHVWLPWCGYEGGERSWWSVSIHVLMPKERCAVAPLHILGWLVASASWPLPGECQWCFTPYWLEECRWAFDIGSCCFDLWPHNHLPASQATPEAAGWAMGCWQCIKKNSDAGIDWGCSTWGSTGNGLSPPRWGQGWWFWHWPLWSCFRAGARRCQCTGPQGLQGQEKVL